jgi:pseudouridine-5'-phosphate glycosidase/pseudouridine kinase
LTVHRELDAGTGLLLAIPIPEESASAGEEIEVAVRTALENAEAEDIRGRDVTPFVLARVNELTAGKSLEANLALIENNASVGASIVQEMHSRHEGGRRQLVSERAAGKSGGDKSDEGRLLRPVVLGGSIFDLVTAVGEPEIVLDGHTHWGSVDFGLGGVGRNLADALALFDEDPAFISAIGNDEQVKNIAKAFINWQTEAPMINSTFLKA